MALVLLAELVSRHMALIARLSIGIICAHDGRLASHLADGEFRLTLSVTLLEESGNLYALARATASLARLESLDTFVVAEHLLVLPIEWKNYHLLAQIA